MLILMMGGLFINSESNDYRAYLYNDSDPQLYLFGNGSTRLKSSGLTTPTVSQTSLESIKKNIAKFDKAIDIVKSADIYEYNFKTENNSNKKHIGLIIGENYNTPNEVISNDGEGIDTYSMTSLAWKAIQEIIERLEVLERG